VIINQVSNFCNTDFETPVIPANANPSLINESLVPCWDTTASDGVIEMWPPGFEGVTAYSGNQLIELNANLVGTLFQDFIVIPGTTISVSFAHRGRQGNDVVGVEIGPVGGPYVSLGNFADGNTAWVLHTVNYTIPTGSENNYTLRFVSVSSAGGSPSIGNLLDSISISSLSCTSAPASGIATSIAVTPVTTFDYPTPICQNATTNPLPGNFPSGFTTGGNYSEDTAVSTGLVFVSTVTGEIDLINSTPGSHTIRYDVLADPSICQLASSSSFTIVINPVVNPVLGFSYTTPICQNAQATLSPTLVTGFTTGGTFSSTTGLSINGTNGVIDLATSTSGNYTITYTSNPNVPSCLVGGTNTFNIVINPVITPVTGFSYSTPFCSSDSVTLQLPTLTVGFTLGGTFSSTPGLSINGTTGEINIPNSTPGVYTITYAIAANVATCQVAGTNSTQVMIIPPVTIELTGGCQSANYILTATPVNDSFVPETASYSWQNAAGTEVGNTQSITVTEIGIYTVTITVDGCSTESLPFDVTSVFCVIQKGISVNNDGLNDTFDLTGFDVKKLTIFNRLGMKVYSRNNYVDEWGGNSDDGDELPDGTYYYVIEQRSGTVKTGWIYINRAQ
jgi:gliding motility-associated-like protein